jgi:hypothetical protein
MRRRRFCALAATVAAGAATMRAGARPAADDAPFAFAVIGDTPYNALEEAALARVLADIDDDVRFVLHLGDLKSGWEPCSDELLVRRHAALSAARRPLVFTPGDNEWVDCGQHRAGAYDPLDRLRMLRRLFFPRREAGRDPLRIVDQAQSDPGHAFPENLRWRMGSVLFVTINVPGSRNGQAAGEVLAAHNARRNSANDAWLREAFALAARESAPAVVVAMHANPGFEQDDHRARLPGDPSPDLDAYAGLRALLRELANGFAGDVLLLHGDTHRFRADRPLGGARGLPVRNFERIECFGSPYANAWLRITVDPRAAARFAVQPRRLDEARP